jgi:hypothetical protein
METSGSRLTAWYRSSGECQTTSVGCSTPVLAFAVTSGRWLTWQTAQCCSEPSSCQTLGFTARTAAVKSAQNQNADSQTSLADLEFERITSFFSVARELAQAFSPALGMADIIHPPAIHREYLGCDKTRIW